MNLVKSGYYVIYCYSLPALVFAFFVIFLVLWLTSRIRAHRIRRVITVFFFLVMLYLTVIKRLTSMVLGEMEQNAVPQLMLVPFWSYTEFEQVEVRWQVYMNVFLFVPFGFMLPWCSSKLQRLWKVVLIAVIFSALTEAAQYFFRIGLCETDDVIHNTLGAVIGYGYWRLLCRIQTHIRGDKK